MQQDTGSSSCEHRLQPCVSLVWRAGRAHQQPQSAAAIARSRVQAAGTLSSQAHVCQQAPTSTARCAAIIHLTVLYLSICSSLDCRLHCFAFSHAARSHPARTAWVARSPCQQGRSSQAPVKAQEPSWALTQLSRYTPASAVTKFRT
jgi:hypothetical protein